jgi:AraC-like DNA-binding protein
MKDAIIDMVYGKERLPISNISIYFANKIGYIYGYISNVFSENTYTSIANFIILRKIERSKQLMDTTELPPTEISSKLNYSNLAHFCTQFKSITGLTPIAFHRLLINRRHLYMNNKLN